jgi:LAS superfamily LD-carboxypeptidase LdcB
MRIIEPKPTGGYLSVNKHGRKKADKLFMLFALLLVISLFTYIITTFTNNETNPTVTVSNQQETNKIDTTVADIEIESGPKNFSGNEFRLLYDNLVLPNTLKIDTPPIISGNDIADARIRQLAELRGYKLRNDIATPLTSIDGYRLQSAVHKPWKQLQAAAASEGIYMVIVSAYRSVESQRLLFLERLQAEGVSLTDVANGTADKEITQVLVTSSIPGYSKHHSGYTIDLLCEGWVFENFKNSDCNKWLVENNYENAKKFGFIPSYPIDADLQGPDPEAWEYVYIGTNLLSQ